MENPMKPLAHTLQNGENIPDPSVPNLKFQISIDSKNILLSTTPGGGKIRAIITELDAGELAKIVECIADAGPVAIGLLHRQVNHHINPESGS
jgi:hypothetical protein